MVNIDDRQGGCPAIHEDTLAGREPLATALGDFYPHAANIKSSASFRPRHCRASATSRGGWIQRGQRRRRQYCRLKGTDEVSGKRPGSGHSATTEGKLLRIFHCIFNPGRLPLKSPAAFIPCGWHTSCCQPPGGHACVSRLRQRTLAVRPGIKTIRLETESRRSWIDEVRLTSSFAT